MAPRCPETLNRRQASLSGWLLFSLPIVLALVFLSINVLFFNFARSTQQITTDASALAAAQSMVDDTMLLGTPTDIANLEDIAIQSAKAYAVKNPTEPNAMVYATGDFTFSTIANPYDANRLLIDTVTIVGQRTKANNNPVPIFGQGMFSINAVNVVTVSKAKQDRHVAGLRPVFSQNIPLAPIAFPEAAWASAIETTYNPTGTFVVTLSSANASYLQAGTLNAAGLANQIANGVAPAELTGAPFNGAFVLDAVNGLSVPVLPGVVAQTDLKIALQGAVGKKIAWPLFSTTDGTTTNVVRLIAAKVISVADKGMTDLDVTFQPTFLSDPSVVTETSRSVNVYLCRVRLTN